MDAFGNAEPRIVPIDPELDPFEFYARLSGSREHSFIFESLTGPQEMAEITVMGFDPETVVRCYRDRVEVSAGGRTETVRTADPLDCVRDLLKKTGNRTYRYLGGAVGHVNYEAASLWESVSPAGPVDEPLMEFGIYDDGVIYDTETGRMLYFYYDTDRRESLKPDGPARRAFSATRPVPDIGMPEFREMVERAKRLVHSGDIFQVVLSRRFDFEVGGDPLEAYRALRVTNPSPYMYYLRQGDRHIIGASPEMLVRVTGDIAETFPIAGTRKVTGSEEENARLERELLSDEKELAEHTMLVDLGRNDMGRVCRPGTVRVEDLMAVKRFSHVQHMVTHVTGVLDGQNGMFDAFRAIFPAGTVTGAPKVRAMEIIGELEPGTRGPYAGAVGYFSYNGCCDFAIAIRSIFVNGGRGYIQSGAGIVSDSRAEAEFWETENKAGAMVQALGEAAR